MVSGMVFKIFVHRPNSLVVHSGLWDVCPESGMLASPEVGLQTEILPLILSFCLTSFRLSSSLFQFLLGYSGHRHSFPLRVQSYQGSLLLNREYNTMFVYLDSQVHQERRKKN